jgi:hypothetical protein
MSKQQPHKVTGIIYRLRIVVGSLTSVVGFMMFMVTAGATTIDFSSTTILISLALFVGGFLIAPTVQLAQTLREMALY